MSDKGLITGLEAVAWLLFLANKMSKLEIQQDIYFQENMSGIILHFL